MRRIILLFPCAFSLGLSSALTNLKGRKGSKIRESGKRYLSSADELVSERVNTQALIRVLVQPAVIRCLNWQGKRI